MWRPAQTTTCVAVYRWLCAHQTATGRQATGLGYSVTRGAAEWNQRSDWSQQASQQAGGAAEDARGEVTENALDQLLLAARGRVGLGEWAA